LLRSEGLRVNRNRVQRRVYREAGLHVRQRPTKRVALERFPKPAICGACPRWSMGFVSDALADGCRFRNLTVVNNATWKCLLIEVERSLPAERDIAAPDRVARSRGYAPTSCAATGPSSGVKSLISWPITTASRWRASRASTGASGTSA
jgi:putative transposase